MNKRAIAILGGIFILIVGTLGFLIYQRSGNDNQTQNNQEANNNQQPTTQTPEEQTPIDPTPEQPQTPKATKLTDDEVVSPILFYQGNGITYFNSQGQLFQTDLQVSGDSVVLSNKRELTIALKSGISKILWPQSGNNFIAEIGSGANRRWSFYDSNTGGYVDLPGQVKSISWLPSSTQIMSVYVGNDGKATLNQSDANGSNYQTITEMYETDDEISVSPDGKSILFWRTQNRDARNIISFLSPDGKVYKAVVNEGYNMGVSWSQDSRRFVFGKRNSTSGYDLWSADLLSGELKNLGVATLPEKAVWSKNGATVFAAVPTRGVAGNGLTEDTIIKINVATGEKVEINPGAAIDAQSLFLSSDETKLFFRNNQDRSLYYIDVSN